MSIKIDKPITGYEVMTQKLDSNPSEDNQPSETIPLAETTGDVPANVVQMHEKVERPERLLGSTYKIKTPLSDHALYVTINDIVLNPDTPYEKRRPFEIFINSKNMDHFQWIVALTRIVSAVFRKGGDVTFLVEELRSVFDPQGGYFKRGGKYTPSLVAEIGDAIEAHMRMIGMIRDEGLEPHQQQLIDQKRRELESQRSFEAVALSPDDESESSFPDGAHLCLKCHNKAMVLLDGCMTCLNCGHSKCG
ncbi:MAG: NrdJb [Acidiferrobacteraceae bacterium]|nr:NrdJb [Acidiferrobacteraceae bacterium]|tara:strand:- start:2958 stop:3704 length:747 start_codon:yes stop_codon:yes gene_type:complete